jgi:hypothetical protein
MLVFKVDRTKEEINNKLQQAYGEDSSKNLKQLRSSEMAIDLRTTYYHLGFINYL